MPFLEEASRAMNNQIERLTGPWQRNTALVLNHVERLTHFQLEAMQHYIQMGMRQWRDALQVRDDKTLREFIERRQQAAEETSRRLSEDAQTLAQITQEFNEQAQQIAESSLRSLSEATRGMTEAASSTIERARKATEAAEPSREAARRAS